MVTLSGSEAKMNFTNNQKKPLNYPGSHSLQPWSSVSIYYILGVYASWPEITGNQRCSGLGCPQIYPSNDERFQCIQSIPIINLLLSPAMIGPKKLACSSPRCTDKDASSSLIYILQESEKRTESTLLAMKLSWYLLEKGMLITARSAPVLMSMLWVLPEN